MSQAIHPTAIIEDGAQIGDGVTVGAYSVIGSHVVIGDSCEIKSHVVIEGHTTIGPNCRIFPFASIGTAPQDLKFSGEESTLIIGASTTIREHVTMNPGTKDGAMETRVGDNCLFMMGSHVAHDCVVGNNVILANNATLAGHVHVGDFVVIGGLSAVHQFTRIGDHAIIGGMSGVENDVIPYGRVKGERAFLKGLNLIGMERRGFSKDDVKQLQRVFKELFASNGTLDERVEAISEQYKDENVLKVIDFIKAKTDAPLCQPQKKVG